MTEEGSLAIIVVARELPAGKELPLIHVKQGRNDPQVVWVTHDAGVKILLQTGTALEPLETTDNIFSRHDGSANDHMARTLTMGLGHKCWCQSSIEHDFRGQTPCLQRAA